MAKRTGYHGLADCDRRPDALDTRDRPLEARGQALEDRMEGPRVLRLTGAASGIADVFEDIEAQAARCRFGDCRHGTEPGCAVQAAIENGRLARSRLARWRKLEAEDAFNSASLAERREKDRDFGKWSAAR